MLIARHIRVPPDVVLHECGGFRSVEPKLTANKYDSHWVSLGILINVENRLFIGLSLANHPHFSHLHMRADDEHHTLRQSTEARTCVWLINYLNSSTRKVRVWGCDFYFGRQLVKWDLIYINGILEKNK